MQKFEFLPKPPKYRSNLNFGLDIVKADFERKLEDHSKRLFGAASTARKLGEGNPWVIKRLFHDFDPDGSNCVDISEFTKLVREHFALKFSDSDIQALFNFYDIDKSGSIEVDEFIQIFSKMNLQSFRKEDGIIDVPSTQVCSENKFKTTRELEYDLRNEIHTKLWKSGLGLKAVLGRACINARDPRDKENMATLECGDVMKYKIRRSDLKSFLRDRFAIGIGNTVELDKYLLRLQEPIYNEHGEIDEKVDGLICAGDFLKAASIQPDHSIRHLGAQLRAVNQNLHVGLKRIRAEFESKLAEYSKRCFGNSSTTRRLKNGQIWVIKRMFGIFDANKNGELDFSEFTKLMRTEMSLLYSDKDTRALFDYYDVHKRGVLSIDELIEMFDKRQLLDDWKATAMEKGSIVDMPSTKINFHHQFLSERELLGELKWEIYSKFIKNRRAFEGVMKTLMKSHFLRGSAARGRPTSSVLSGNVDEAGVPIELGAGWDRSTINGKISTYVEKEAFKIFLRDENGIGIGNAKALDQFLDQLEQNGKIDFLHVLLECGWKPKKVQQKLAREREQRKKTALMTGGFEHHKKKFQAPKARKHFRDVPQNHGSVISGAAAPTRAVAAPTKNQRPQTARPESSHIQVNVTPVQTSKSKARPRTGFKRLDQVSTIRKPAGPKRPSKSAGATRSHAPRPSGKKPIHPPSCAFSGHRNLRVRQTTTSETRTNRAQAFVAVAERRRQPHTRRKLSGVAQQRMKNLAMKRSDDDTKIATLRAWQQHDYQESLQDSLTLNKYGQRQRNLQQWK